MSCWIGLLLGTQRSGMPFGDMYAAVREESRAAADGGFHALVAPEHLDADTYRMLQPWPLLGAMREAVGAPIATVASIIAGLTSADRIAADVRTLRAIGDGPAGVALAAGYRPEDFAAARRPFGERWTRRAEILNALAQSGACDSGWLWSAAGTKRAARHACEAAVPVYGPPTAADDDAIALGVVGGHGLVLRRDVLIGAGEAELRDLWERFGAPKYGAYTRWGFTDGVGAASTVVAGRPLEVAAALRDTIRRTAAAGLVVRLCWPDMTASESVAHVNRFVADVMPALRSAPPVPPMGAAV